MFQELRRFLSIDRVADHPQPSNQVTPSRKRHINSLPTELLIMIFQHSCGPPSWCKSDPVLLCLVCRFWHTIVTACPALWTTIEFKRYIPHNPSCRVIGHSITCRNWSNLERALTRAGTATISLEFHLSALLYPRNEEERLLQLLSRCRELHIIIQNATQFTFASSITMPHLEHVELELDANAHIEPLLDSIEKRSPLLRSLSIAGFVPTNLARHKSLLRRIVRLNLSRTDFDDTVFQRLQNLEELTINSSESKFIKLCPSDLPKLVSLYIGNIVLPRNQQPMTFHLLESLKLEGKWSYLQFIAAPKLRNLILTHREPTEPEWTTVSALRRSSVRPMSLSLDFVSDIYLPELLDLWSDLSDLHLRRWECDCPNTTAALSGSGSTAPLCSLLRYLTVHVRPVNSIIVDASVQRLKSIVKKREGYGIVGLQRVMCILDQRHNGGTKGIEWVDIL